MTLLMNNLNKEKTERITLTYAHLPADVQFGGFAPALALFAPDINVARKWAGSHSSVRYVPFNRHAPLLS